MQSTDISTVDVDPTDSKLTGNKENDDVVEVSKTLPENDVVCGVEEEGLEKEEGNDDMEVDFVENTGSMPVLEGFGDVVEKGSVNGEENGVDVGDSRAGMGQSECSDVCGGEDDLESGGKASVARRLFPKAVNEDVVGEKGMSGGIDGSSIVIDGGVVEVNEPSGVIENQAIGDITDARVNDKENIEGNAAEGGDFESKGELQNRDLAGVTDSVGSDKKNIGDNVIEGGSLDIDGELQNQSVMSDPIVGVTPVSEENFSVTKGDGLGEASRGSKSKKKGKFCISDLVWGKVRSHPWWPAQIFDPEDASAQAKKHFRSKSYLVAYFGDQTFAWNEEAKLKPFEPHFSQMTKQSNAEAFRDAVECALEEAASRAEFGLSCPCITDDVYSRLKVQVIENAGIRESTRIRESRERLYAASTFEPLKFLDHVKNLAQLPLVEENDRLEHVVVHAQMSAFYRWKGCYHLAEFGQLIGYVNNEADDPASKTKEDMHQMISDATLTPQEKMEEEDDVKPHKRKKVSGDSGKSTKKVKHLSDSMLKKAKKDVSKQEDDVEETEEKTDKKFISSLVRCKKAKLYSNESKSKENSPQITPSRESKPGLRVGEGILRAALQLSQPSPLLKLDVSSQGETTKSKHSRQTEANPFKKSSPDDILSKVLLLAVDPLEEHSFVSSMIRFLADFRGSVVQDVVFLKNDGESESYDIVDKSKERPSGSGHEEMNEDIVQKESGQETENVLSERGPSDEDIPDESPTALTLKFTDMDSIPTETKLNHIFSSFGPLKESETEVLAKKNCARVVFKRRKDADTAFSSSGKFETFGASLVCYQLNYAPSPRKSSSPDAKRRRKDETLVESIGA
ncbi:PWWP domain-containing protein 5 [Silene latifolia]|uniref:PWWP domain-containing protein 5 n=1 Tax=Silene latifolia TaxID=37657 RepID=UPI003D76AE40